MVVDRQLKRRGFSTGALTSKCIATGHRRVVLLSGAHFYSQEAFDRIDFEGVVAESEGKGRGEVDPAAGCSCKIERGEIQLLLADAGELMTKLRVRYFYWCTKGTRYFHACALYIVIP